VGVTEQHTLNNLSEKVGRLEAMQMNNTEAVKEMASSVNRLVEKLEESDDIAREALEKSKSAHKRIDSIEEDKKVNRSRIEWFLKLVLTPIIVGALGLIWWLILEYSKSKG